MSIEEKVKSIVSEQFHVGLERIVSETSFNGLHADSLDVVELVMALEEAFNIQILDEDMGKLTTVGSTIKYIESRVKS